MAIDLLYPKLSPEQLVTGDRPHHLSETTGPVNTSFCSKTTPAKSNEAFQASLIVSGYKSQTPQHPMPTFQTVRQKMKAVVLINMKNKQAKNLACVSPPYDVGRH